MASIGVKVELEGAPQYVENMKNLQQQTNLYNEQLKKVQTQMSNSSAFSKSIAESKALQQQQEALTNQQTLLAQKIKDASEKYGENSTQVLRLKTQYEQLETKLISVNNDLKAHGGYLGAVGAELKEVGSKISSIGSSISSFGDKLTMGVTMPLVAMGTAAANSFAEVDKTMQLTNATMNNTAEQAELLNKAMKEAAANSTFGMTDAATATLNFARAGLSAEQAAASLAPAMNLAAGEGGELETVSAGLVATINGFADSFDEASRYADVFAAACNNSALDVDSLSESMSVAAPIFSAAGYEVEDAALYMGVMANAGIEASVAANALKTGLARLVSPAKEGSVWLDNLGISVTRADGTMKSSIELQSELNAAFSKLSESEQIAAASAIFGKNQMSNWLALINTAPADVQALMNQLQGASFSVDDFSNNLTKAGKSIDTMKKSANALGVSSEIFDEALLQSGGSAEMLADILWEASDAGVAYEDVVNALGGDLTSLQAIMDETAGTTDTMAAAMMSGFGGSMEQLKSSIDVAATSFGEALAPTILAVAEKIQQLVTWFNSLSSEQQAMIAKIALIVAAVGPVIAIVGRVISGIGSVVSVIGTVASFIGATLIPAISAIVAAIAPVIAAIAPFIAIAAAVVAAIIGIVEAIKHWDEITLWFSETWESVTTTVSSLWASFKESFLAVLDNIKNTWSNVWNNVKTVVTTIFTNIKTAISSKITEIKTTLTNFVDNIKTTFTDLKDKALQWGKDMIQGFIDGIKAMIDKVKETASDVASAVADFLHFSEPDVGPMKNFNDWPRDMMSQYAEGMEAGRYLVQNAAADVASDIAVLNNDTLSADEIYNAVNAGASNANISLSIGSRELARALSSMGVVFA